MTFDPTLPTEFFDLRALSRELPPGKQYRRLRGLIEKAMSARSVQSDLHHAEQHVELLLDRLRQQRDPEHAHAEAMTDHAILAYAIILYARATKSRSRHRASFDDLQRALDKDEASLHRRLCALRDDAIAHFGTGPTDAGFEWASEAVLLVAQERGFRVGAVSRRVLVNDPFARDLHAMTGRMKALAEVKARDVSRLLVAELEARARAPGFRDLVHRHSFDLVAHMGGVDAARDAWQSMVAGFGTGFSSRRG